MAADLLGLGVTMLRCLAGSAVGFMVSKGVRSAASESSSSSIRSFLQKDIDQIREKMDSLAQSKLSAALQNVRQGLILLDQQYSIAAPAPASSTTGPGHQQEAGADCGGCGTISLCVTTRAVLAADSPFEISADIRCQFEAAQQLAVEAFHDKRNVPPMLRVECVKLQLFCTMLIYHRAPERWLNLWTVILEELTKDKELMSAASSACGESGGDGQMFSTKSALSVFWRRSNTDLSQAMYHLVDNLHCALVAALWHPHVDGRIAFGRSRILQYPRLLLCSAAATSTTNQQPSSSGSSCTVNLAAPFLYPWRSDRVVVVLPYVFKLLSLYPTNKILSAQVRPIKSSHSSQAFGTPSFSLHVLDITTLTEDESLHLASGQRLLDVDFDRQSLNLLLLSSSTTATGDEPQPSVISYNLQFEKVFKINLTLGKPCSQIVWDPVGGSVIAFDGTSPDDEVYVLKKTKKNPPAGEETTTFSESDWASYENIFKCMLTDRPGHVQVAYSKPFRETFGDGGGSCESGLEIMLYNRFTDVVYSLISSFDEENESMEGSPVLGGISDDSAIISSTTSNLSTMTTTEEESIANIQQIYPLKAQLLKVRVSESGNLGGEDILQRQKVMLEEGGVFENERLVWAKEKCLASCSMMFDADVDYPPSGPISNKTKTTKPALVGAFVINDDTSTLHICEVIAGDSTTSGGRGMSFKIGDELQLPLICEQLEDRYLGGIVWMEKFIFVGAAMCKVKISE